MKKILTLIAAAMISMGANAQFSTERKFFNRAHAGLIEHNWTGSRFDTHFWGLELGYEANFKVLPSAPLYVNGGLNYNVAFGRPDDYEMKEGGKHSVLTSQNFEIPVNATYRYKVEDTNIILSPYAGFHLRINSSLTDSHGDDVEFILDPDYFNPVQVGYQFGLNFDLGKIYFAAEHNQEFSPYGSSSHGKGHFNTSTRGFRVRAGFIF